LRLKFSSRSNYLSRWKALPVPSQMRRDLNKNFCSGLAIVQVLLSLTSTAVRC